VNVFDWLPIRFGSRGKALSLYKRGLARAKTHDREGAIDDYTTTIDMPGTPSDLRAMALYNRALAHAAAGDNPRGLDDLGTVLAMDDSPANVKTLAKQKLARMESRSRKSKV